MGKADKLLKDFVDEFERYRLIGQKTLDQVDSDGLNRVLSTGSNSIAVIVRHVGGNLVSRFTDFLNSDGEKPWRDRDAEFENRSYSREEVNEWWDKGWQVLNNELANLGEADLEKRVSNRGVPFTVHEALARSVTHVAYHVGQMVILARLLTGEDWKWISIPPGKTNEYNRNPTQEKKPE